MHLITASRGCQGSERRNERTFGKRSVKRLRLAFMQVSVVTVAVAAAFVALTERELGPGGFLASRVSGAARTVALGRFKFGWIPGYPRRSLPKGVGNVGAIEIWSFCVKQLPEVS